MNAKQFLKRHLSLEKQIKTNERKIQEIRNKATSIGSYDYSGVKVVTSPEPYARYEDVVAELVEWENKLRRQNARSAQEMIQIEKIVASVPDKDQRDVLNLRYIAHMKFSKVAEEVSFCERNVYELHSKGLKWLEKHCSELQ